MKPNLIFVFSDQHRAQATGFSGNKTVKTPNMDILYRESVNFTTAVSGCPVCCPYRAGLLTGQNPLTHGIFMNDVSLNPEAVTLAKLYKDAGYDTAYIGKWHIDGHGRSAFIPRERRQGFDYWRVLECTHDYNHSYYYGDEPEKKIWEGYDAAAQTDCAIDYLKSRNKSEKPFILFLSWGPPHNPYQSAPQEFCDLYRPEDIPLRPNVPEEAKEQAKTDLAGYYAHVSALDFQLGKLMSAVKASGIEENTIFIYTSDHGDMLGSHGYTRKQKPWDESILVPFLLRFPAQLGEQARTVDVPFCTQDILPTLLDFCDIPIPESAEGVSFADYIKGGKAPNIEAAVIESIQPFGEWPRAKNGTEYRGIRTKRYTYVRDLNGPWLLYDNEKDPYQFENLIGKPEYAPTEAHLDELLQKMLKDRGDEFLPGEAYVKKWGYPTDETGTVPYTN
ncbi:MAG TPA: sulfatase [Oscillospiraceae bacterium]|nr:sulfatase [Oscillospiraceae bacterium]HPF55100.1 sulfatase [Clostridiales bacterium]HPK34412.1 sulfatase [Oscillospiraceae bacterium]HPR75603.1 sulfatase [Oscillospiraceae bacterium]